MDKPGQRRIHHRHGAFHRRRLEFTQRVLGVHYTPDKHDAEGLANAAEALMSKFMIAVKQVTYATHDSASAQVAAIDRLGWESQRCADHSLDLAAKEATHGLPRQANGDWYTDHDVEWKELKRADKKLAKDAALNVVLDAALKDLKNIVTYCRNSPEAALAVVKMFQRVHSTYEVLIQDVQTRWNSTNMMSRRATSSRPGVTFQDAGIWEGFPHHLGRLAQVP